ncbi:alpha/beta fold hydrolase [Streptomyces sp. NPDC002764]|uniref:alpha/beta fold hydrolase n=1 Tax=Streptomyces sp. NPDC002764 TaxID=3154428 RepID=UPI003327EC74
MSALTHQTAPTQFVEADGVRYACRLLGPEGTVPLVMPQHFTGNLDNWDPACVDAPATEREVVLVDCPGVSASSGTPATTVAAMAQQMITFTVALGLDRIDLLGFSIGGFVAQDMALIRPRLIRRLVPAGTGPKGAPGTHGWRKVIETHARAETPTGEDLLHIFFAHTETSQAEGVEFLGRFTARSEDRDAPSSLASRDARYDSASTARG